MGTPDDKTATPDNSTDTATNRDTSLEPQRKEGESTVDWEKRFKDTQAGYTQSRQEIVKLKAQLAAAEIKPQLTDAQKEALEDLKYQNPDEWYKQMKALETTANSEYETKLAAVTTELSEKEQRVIILEEFKYSHPGFEINDDILEHDVPKRITNKIGKIPFDEFLSEVHEFLSTPKAVANTEITKKPNLNNMGGSDTVSTMATDDDIRQSYKNEVF